MNVGNLAGDIYLNFFLMVVVEIPGALMIWVLMSRYCYHIFNSSLSEFCSTALLDTALRLCSGDELRCVSEENVQGHFWGLKFAIRRD